MNDFALSTEQALSIQPDGRVARNGEPVTQEDLARQFDEEYYRTGCGDVPYSRTEPRWAAFFGMVADEVIRALRPRLVLDAGCAMGFLVEAFWDRGVEAKGIDISPYAIAQVRRDMQPHCRVGSVADGIEGTYDLITCIEVLEHMPEEQAKAAVRHLTRATDTLLFSSTPYDVTEPTHYNVRPYISWLQLFQEHGFSPDLEFDASFVAAQAMLLRRRPEPFSVDVLRTFAALLHKRYELIHRTNRVNELSHQVAHLSAQVHDRDVRLNSKEAEVQAVQVQRNELAEARAQAERLVAERDAAIVRLRQEITDVMERLHATERELAASAEVQTGLRNELAEANEVISALQATQEDTLSMLLEANQRLTQQESEDSALCRKLHGMDRSLGEQTQKLAIVEQQLAVIEQRSTEAWTIARSILDSRIWKVLVSGGGVLLRLGGRRPA